MKYIGNVYSKETSNVYLKESESIHTKVFSIPEKQKVSWNPSEYEITRVDYEKGEIVFGLVKKN